MQAMTVVLELGLSWGITFEANFSSWWMTELQGIEGLIFQGDPFNLNFGEKGCIGRPQKRSEF